LAQHSTLTAVSLCVPTLITVHYNLFTMCAGLLVSYLNITVMKSGKFFIKLNNLIATFYFKDVDF